MSVEVGIPAYKIVMDQVPAQEPGGECWAWSVSVQFEDNKVTEVFKDRDAAGAFFQSAINVLDKSYRFIERKHKQNVFFYSALFFFFGICFGAGIVLLSKFVFT